MLKEQVLQGVQMIKDQRAEKYSEASAEKSGIMHIRRHLAATPLFKGIPNFKETRIAMLRAENLTDLFAIMDTIF